MKLYGENILNQLNTQQIELISDINESCSFKYITKQIKWLDCNRATSIDVHPQYSGYMCTMR